MTIKVEKWSVKKFINTKDNPIQRNTEKHLKSAVKRHLKTYSPSHSRVEVALLNGEYIKLNGHTRAMAWAEGLLKAPKQLLVDVYKCKSMDEVKKFYLEFDNAQATELAPDKIYGALRGEGVQVKSTLMVHGGLTTAIQTLDPWSASYRRTRRPIHEVLPYWIDAIKTGDKAMLGKKNFPVGIIMALLLSLKKSKSALEFWSNYDNDLGQKSKGECDGVQMLIDAVAKRRLNHQIGGWRNNMDMCATALTLYEAWCEGTHFTKKSKIEMTDVFAYRANVCKKLMADYKKFQKESQSEQTDLAI